MRMLIILGLLMTLCPIAAQAVSPDERLDNIELEARARVIGSELRCLVCQNESIDASDAPLAHDLRVLLRQRLLAGDTDEAAKQYIVARYGDYVLLKPPFKESTLALWLGPLLLFGAAMGGAALFYRQRRVSALPLSADERERLDVLMKEDVEESES